MFFLRYGHTQKKLCISGHGKKATKIIFALISLFFTFHVNTWCAVNYTTIRTGMLWKIKILLLIKVYCSNKSHVIDENITNEFYVTTQLAITCSKLTIETLEQGLKYV